MHGTPSEANSNASRLVQHCALLASCKVGGCAAAHHMPSAFLALQCMLAKVDVTVVEYVAVLTASQPSVFNSYIYCS